MIFCRLKQCLSVFFEHYPSLSVNHKVRVDTAAVLLNFFQLAHKCGRDFCFSHRSHLPKLQKCLSKAFLLVMRSLWPGINGNAAGSSVMVSNMRKRAVQASRFLLQMMQVPLLAKETTGTEDNKNENAGVETDPSLDFESGEEGLAIQIAVEVCSFI